jgi:hypothetical protein
MATQAQLDSFISLMQAGQYEAAARVAQQAGYSSADVAAYVNANAAGLGLGPETGFQGVSAADVASFYAQEPITEFPLYTTPNPEGGFFLNRRLPGGGVQTIATGSAQQLISSYPQAAPLFKSDIFEYTYDPSRGLYSTTDYTEEGVPYTRSATTLEGLQRDIRQLYPGAEVVQRGTTTSPASTTTTTTTPNVDRQAVDMLAQFDALMAAGNYNAAALLLDQAGGIYGPDTYKNIADYLNIDPKYAGLRDQVGGETFTPENLIDFITNVKASQPPPSGVQPGGVQPGGVQPGGPSASSRFVGLYQRGPEEEAAYQRDLASIPIRTNIPLPTIPMSTGVSPAMARIQRTGEMTPEQYYSNIREVVTGGQYTPAELQQMQQQVGTSNQDIGVAMGTTIAPISITTPTMPGATADTTQSIGQFIQSKAPTTSVAMPTAPSMFSPENVRAQLELERLRLQPTPEEPVAGFAQGGLVSDDINRMLQNQRNAVQRESQSRQMLTRMGAPPVKKFSNGGPAGSSSGVRRLKMSGYQEGGEVDLVEQMMVGTRPEDLPVKRQKGSPPEGEKANTPVSTEEFIKSLSDSSRRDVATVREALAEIGKNRQRYAELAKQDYTPNMIADPVKNAAYGLFLTSQTSDNPDRFLSTLSPFYDSKIEFDYTTDRSVLGEVQPYSQEARVYTTGDRGVALHELVHTLQMRQAHDIAKGEKEINYPMIGKKGLGSKIFSNARDLEEKGEISFPATNWKRNAGEFKANVYDMSRRYEEAGKDFTKSAEFKKLFPDEASQLYYYTQILPDTSVMYPAGSSFEPIKTRDKSKSFARQLLGFAAGGEVTDFIKRAT